MEGTMTYLPHVYLGAVTLLSAACLLTATGF